MGIKTTVSNAYLSISTYSINVFDCRLPGVSFMLQIGRLCLIAFVDTRHAIGLQLYL